MKRLKIGVIGWGWFGRIHGQAWSEVPGADVVAICDPALAGPASASDQQDEFHRDVATLPGFQPGPQVHRYECVEAMLAQEEIDVLDVVSPEAMHAEHVIAGLEAGLPVIVEKPLTTSRHDAERIAAAAERHGLPVYVGHVLRFDRRYVAMKELIDAGSGDFRHLSFQRHFQRSAHRVYGRSHPYFSALVHDIDLALWLVPRPIRRVLGSTASFLRASTPDIAVGVLEWDDGLLAVLQNSWHLGAACPYGFEFETKVFTASETFCIRNQPDLSVWGEREVTAPELNFWPLLTGRRGGALVDELTHFSECARECAPSRTMPLKDALRSIEVAEALIRSAQSRRWEEP